jgi:serine phosphatase RsbU (regulator of sigma subunit)/anti-sigma regulatory factor (Ser/Thr protein kinase)
VTEARTDIRALIRTPAESGALVSALRAEVEAITRPGTARLWAEPSLAQSWEGALSSPPFDPSSAFLQPLLDSPGVVTRQSLSGNVVIPPGLEAEAYLPLVALGQVIGLLLLDDVPDSAGSSLAGLANLVAPALLAARQLETAQTTRRALEQTADELRVAEIIQRSLLPETLPDVAGWQLDAWYEPARVIGGDLYDFIRLPGDLVGIVLGDASDKGVPAALVMATTRALLRAAAMRLVLPGLVLAQVNDDLAAQIPPGVFVTCFYAILDTATGRLRYANAGQCAPLLATGEGVEELGASGWPLGMLPGRTYEEGNLTLEPGSAIVLYSDGVSETHNPEGVMLGTGGIREVVTAQPDRLRAVEDLVAARRAFVGDEREQHDDVTVVGIARLVPETAETAPDTGAMRTVARFAIPSVPETERAAADRVLAEISDAGLTDTQRQRLHTAVAEAFMNAAEHGNQFHPDLPVEIEVLRSETAVTVRISDKGRGGPLPEQVTPNIDAKLAGLQSPRGWGLFLIREMVDEAKVTETGEGVTVQLTVQLQKEQSNV